MSSVITKQPFHPRDAVKETYLSFLQETARIFAHACERSALPPTAIIIEDFGMFTRNGRRTEESGYYVTYAPDPSFATHPGMATATTNARNAWLTSQRSAMPPEINFLEPDNARSTVTMTITTTVLDTGGDVPEDVIGC